MGWPPLTPMAVEVLKAYRLWRCLMGKFSKSQSWLLASIITHLPHGLGGLPILGKIFFLCFWGSGSPSPGFCQSSELFLPTTLLTPTVWAFFFFLPQTSSPTSQTAIWCSKFYSIPTLITWSWCQTPQVSGLSLIKLPFLQRLVTSIGSLGYPHCRLTWFQSQRAPHTFSFSSLIIY